mmetsp:Transcript_1710/g.3456  ORF Transcript_1710/g.3456 Transcript_1710/m.3456 type:complete len:261 (+) Transcript_1710:2061-2843(+)
MWMMTRWRSSSHPLAPVAVAAAPRSMREEAAAHERPSSSRSNVPCASAARTAVRVSTRAALLPTGLMGSRRASNHRLSSRASLCALVLAVGRCWQTRPRAACSLAICWRGSRRSSRPHERPLALPRRSWCVRCLLFPSSWTRRSAPAGMGPTAGTLASVWAVGSWSISPRWSRACHQGGRCPRMRCTSSPSHSATSSPTCSREAPTTAVSGVRLKIRSCRPCCSTCRRRLMAAVGRRPLWAWPGASAVSRERVAPESEHD